jgi:anti-anti-sigma factor
MCESGVTSTGSTTHSAAPHPLFEIDVGIENDAYVIRVEGELDLSAHPRLERALADAEASQASLILLDLDRLTYIDAAGVETLLAAAQRSASNGDRLRITPGKGEVAHEVLARIG